MRLFNATCCICIGSITQLVFAQAISSPILRLHEIKPQLESVTDKVIAYGLEGAPYKPYRPPNLKDAATRLNLQPATPILTVKPQHPVSTKTEQIAVKPLVTPQKETSPPQVTEVRHQIPVFPGFPNLMPNGIKGLASFL